MSSHNFVFPDPPDYGPMDWSVSEYGAAPMSLGPDPLNHGYTAPPPPVSTLDFPGHATPKAKPKSRAMVNRIPLNQGSGKRREREQPAMTSDDQMRWSNDNFYDFFGSSSNGMMMAPMLPQNLNPECTRPNEWSMKSPWDICSWQPKKPEFDGRRAQEMVVMYAPRNRKITGPMKAPAITFTRLEGVFPPTIRSLVFDEESAEIINHCNDPLFLPPPTREEKKAYLTILYDIPHVDLFWETLPKYHRDGRSLTRGELAKAVSNVLWGTWIRWQENAGCCKEWEMGKAYTKPKMITMNSDPWRLELVRPRTVRLAGLNCFGEVWVPLILMDLPTKW